MTTEPLLPLAAAARQMEELREALLLAFTGSAHHPVRALAGEVSGLRTSDAVVLVLVGQHDAGKSSLLRCLTGRDDIEVAAGPTTTVSRRYEWDGHVLVDTPGVLAGVDMSHDALSWQALGAADVVVFVTTVEGLDDETVEYFEQVKGRLRSLSTLVFVVNKVLSERSDPTVVAQDLLEALGPAAEAVPVVWTDAKRWLEADDREDSKTARLESGVQDLADQLTGIARASGAQLRLLAVLRGWSEVGQRALRLMAESSGGTDEPLLHELDGLLEALMDQHLEGRSQVQRRAEAAVAALRRDLLQAGPGIDEPTLTDLVQRAYDVFGEAVARDGADRDAALERWRPEQTAAGSEVALPAVDLTALVQNSLGQVARMFSGAGARPGGAGHTIVYNTWKYFGGKFRSWGAVNASRTIGKTAGRANVAFTVGLAGWELLQTRRQVQAAAAQARAVADWNAGSSELAQGIVQPWHDDALQVLESVHDVRSRDIARQRLAVLARLSERDEEAAGLLALEVSIERLCASLERSQS